MASPEGKITTCPVFFRFTCWQQQQQGDGRTDPEVRGAMALFSEVVLLFLAPILKLLLQHSLAVLTLRLWRSQSWHPPHKACPPV